MVEINNNLMTFEQQNTHMYKDLIEYFEFYCTHSYMPVAKLFYK